MEKLVNILSKNDSLSFFSLTGKPIPEEKVLGLIKQKLLDLKLTKENEGILACVSDNDSMQYKRSLEIFLAPYSSVLFNSGKSRVPNNGVWRLIKEDCFLYAKRSANFILSYLLLAEYESLEKHGRIY